MFPTYYYRSRLNSGVSSDYRSAAPFFKMKYHMALLFAALLLGADAMRVKDNESDETEVKDEAKLEALDEAARVAFTDAEDLLFMQENLSNCVAHVSSNCQDIPEKLGDIQVMGKKIMDGVGDTYANVKLRDPTCQKAKDLLKMFYHYANQLDKTKDKKFVKTAADWQNYFCKKVQDARVWYGDQMFSKKIQTQNLGSKLQEGRDDMQWRADAGVAWSNAAIGEARKALKLGEPPKLSALRQTQEPNKKPRTYEEYYEQRRPWAADPTQPAFGKTNGKKQVIYKKELDA